MLSLSFKGAPDPKAGLWYLASPYSAPDAYTRENRYMQVMYAGGELITKGFMLIEPITMTHHTAKLFKLPPGYEYWKARDRAFIDACQGLIVLLIPGWFESVGVSDEIEHAFLNNKPVYLYQTNFNGNAEFMQLDEASYYTTKTERAAQELA